VHDAIVCSSFAVAVIGTIFIVVSIALKLLAKTHSVKQESVIKIALKESINMLIVRGVIDCEKIK
jgi:hypothetical protein